MEVNMKEAGVKGRRGEEPDTVMHVHVYFLLALLRHYYVTCSNGMFAFVADSQSLWQSGGAQEIQSAQGSGF
jgi:hypothetical protein